MAAHLNPAIPVVNGRASMPAPICVPATNKIPPIVLFNLTDIQGPIISTAFNDNLFST